MSELFEFHLVLNYFRIYLFALTAVKTKTVLVGFKTTLLTITDQLSNPTPILAWGEIAH